ncbi:MAG TPA: hypothetical protein VFE21_01885 [Rubrobacteraceae bacterium]|nr:hypothetical protein [Rubrobacteraceae bacterium]
MSRVSLFILAFIMTVPASLAARPVLAHGFEGRYDLPVPLWLYLYGSAAAVLLSFVVVGLFVGKEHSPHRYPRYNLLRIGVLRVLFESRALRFALRLISVGLFLLLILTGFFGEQAPGYNFAPTFVWIIWWVGFSFFVAFVGNLWPLLNPWKVLFEWADGLARRLGMENGLELEEPYPESWGVWPALALYFLFVWVELVFGGSPTPFNIALLAVLYSLVTWAGMAVFGKEVWLRNGEPFSVFFGILAGFAPTEVRVTDSKLCRECESACGEGRECVNCYECFGRAAPEDREINVRPPAIGLARAERVSVSRTAFVIFMLASVTYDGLSATPLWNEVTALVVPITQSFGNLGNLVSGTLGLVVVPLLFLAVYLTFVWLSRLIGGGEAGVVRVAGAYAYSLVPIALVYQVAHYYTLFIFNGQIAIVQISDPFGWGWNLFGTADYQINNAVLGAAFVWYSQVALIVAGHVIAVYLAHAVALRLLDDSKRTQRSQYPILMLMILYTVSSLWIISQPIIDEDTAAVPPGEQAMLEPAERTTVRRLG